MRVVLVCDESSAKGRADKTERRPGEVGVLAGLILLEEQTDAFRRALEPLVRPYHTTGAKLHMASVPEDKRDTLRDDVFELIKAHNVACLYEAIHVEGFHAMHQTMDNLVQRIREGQPEHIVRLTRDEDPALLHGQLFQGLYGKALVYCRENGWENVDLKVLVDRVDESILRLFREKAKEILDFEPKRSTTEFFDRLGHQRHSQTVTSVVPEAESLFGYLRPASTTIDPSDDSIVFAADVLANGVAYHFSRRTGDQIGQPLDSRAAIAGHPLEALIGCVTEPGGYSFVDTVLRHPTSLPEEHE